MQKSESSVIRYINEDLITRFWPIAVAFTVVYIPISFFVLNDPFTGWLFIGNLFLMAGTIAYFYKTRNVTFVSHALVFLAIPSLLPWLITGGPAGAGLWVSLGYVVWAFFLTPKKWAIFWLSLYCGLAIVITLISLTGLYSIAYSLFELVNLLFIFLLTSGLVYLFNETNAYYFNRFNEELQERRIAEQKFKALLDSTPDALIITDGNNQIVMVNRQAVEVFGYEPAEIENTALETLIPAGWKDFSLTPDAFGKRKDGSEFPVDITMSPLHSEGLVLSAVRDITEDRQQQEKLRNYSILEAKSKEMEQFTYIASHDLRHPLLTILNYIKILEKDYMQRLDEDGKMCLELVSDAANRMDKLVLGLLDYSRLSKIKELEQVDCNNIVSEVLADLNAIITETQAQVDVNKLPLIFAYPLELRQLFQNLLANALKFRKPGVQPQVYISAKPEKDGWQFEIRDNGIGIKEKDTEKIFQIFQRLHTTNEYEGLGLGLAYCKKITELHNGTIGIRSIPGEGSTFYFTLKTSTVLS